jgi:lipopolysaccharide export system protein LptA
MDLLNRVRKLLSLFFISSLLLGCTFSAASAAEVLQKKGFGSGNEPIVIRSVSMEIDNKKRVVVFTGSVEAKKEDMLIRCQKMSVHYQDKGPEKASENKGFKIDRIIAKGEVKIDREGGSATADEAVYYEDEEKLVLHGNPKVKQGEDYVEGSIITVFLKEDRSVVEGGGDQKVKAVLAPRDRKR